VRLVTPTSLSNWYMENAWTYRQSSNFARRLFRRWPLLILRLSGQR